MQLSQFIRSKSIFSRFAKIAFLCAVAMLFVSVSVSARAQSSAKPSSSSASQSSMPGMDMAANPHMFMTELAPKQPGDDRHAQEIVDTLGKSIAKYRDYKLALAEGYHIFAPNVPQPIYHFTNNRNAIAEQFTFNPARPTSLLYKKTADGYELVGAMYTAPRRYTEEQLNERVPLSVARWHKHVNFCLPPLGTLRNADWKKFGPAGSIASQDACDAAGGRFIPQVYGWMVHVYPYQTDPDKVWAH
jgi:hypothetical protein